MTVHADGQTLRLQGVCGVEEAETLVGLLQSGRYEAVDLGQCRELHTAVVQALLAWGPSLTGISPDPFLREHLAPALEGARPPQTSGPPIEGRNTSDMDGSPLHGAKR